MIAQPIRTVNKPSARPIPLDPDSDHYRELIAAGCVPPGTESRILDPEEESALIEEEYVRRWGLLQPAPYVPLPEMEPEDRPAYLSDLHERDAAIVQLAEELAALKRRAT